MFASRRPFPSDRVINNPPDSLVNGEAVTMAKP